MRRRFGMADGHEQTLEERGGSAEGVENIRHIEIDHQIFAFSLEVWLSEERTLSSPAKRTSQSGSSVKGLWQNFERHIAIQSGVSRAIADKDLGHSET